ncbi:MAG: hypothetical protein CME64_11015 [Halobacteriovoraceae bacterium]|nr:hypothetical protein [Halobacteriovoraceae bacterium]
MKKILILGLLSFYSFGGVLEFRPELESICGKSNKILVKKILLGLAKQKRARGASCGSDLKFLSKSCEANVVCEDILASYKEFLNNNSSRNLIGE